MKNRIEKLRNEKGIRQEELARELGVSRQTCPGRRSVPWKTGATTPPSGLRTRSPFSLG